MKTNDSKQKQDAIEYSIQTTNNTLHIITKLVNSMKKIFVLTICYLKTVVKQC